MPFRSHCRSCWEFRQRASYCSMECSKKGNTNIKPQNFTMNEIKKVLENNIGIYISEANISIYSREILELIN